MSQYGTLNFYLLKVLSLHAKPKVWIWGMGMFILAKLESCKDQSKILRHCKCVIKTPYHTRVIAENWNFIICNSIIIIIWWKALTVCLRTTVFSFLISILKEKSWSFIMSPIILALIWPVFNTYIFLVLRIWETF